MNKKTLLCVLFLVCTFNGFSQLKKNIRKAENAIYKGCFEEAKQYYLKAYSIDSTNYKAAYGVGITMSDYMENYETCLPYLEKALKLSVKDTVPDLIYALGKTYHFLGRYQDAIVYYNKMLRFEEPDNTMYEPELKKRIQDCEYALAHPEYTNASKWYIVNAGKTINTAMPEYVPVLIGNDKLIFTSKRKDNKKERINPDNGKYYESIYSSTISNGHTSAPVLFRIPEQPGKQKTNSNQSVISAMAGGKKIFVYEKGKLFESDLTATTKSPEEESKVINFDSYQNHAFLDKTDKVLYFTSESPNGQGGNDIYRSYRTADGQWSAPENLGDVINTPFDEEAPFISEDGNTLYFASNGFPGYGGYDIYKSTLVNGKWSVPENLGQPVNSPANDIFYSESVDGSVAYMSSSRKGGQGDMDIYKINYTDKQPKSCNANLDDFLSLDFKKNDLNNGRHLITAAIPDKMKDQIISFELKVDDSLIGNFDSKMEFNFKQEGDHTINAKLVAWCDTCINTLVACTEKKLSITNINPDLTISTNLNANNNSNTADLSLSKVFNDAHGTLDKTLLKQIGFDLTPLYFKKNEANLTDDAVSILEKNMELLKKYPDLKIIINGYADSRGSENYNQKLSEHRAGEVKKYFNKNHLKNQTEVVGKGETELVNKCGNDVDCDETMHQQNRRVEFTIIKK